MGKLIVTVTMLRIMREFLRESRGARLHCYGLSKLLDVNNDRAWDALQSMQSAGWLTSAIEPYANGTPNRRLYRMTERGRAEAIRQLALVQTDWAPTPAIMAIVSPGSGVRSIIQAST